MIEEMEGNLIAKFPFAYLQKDLFALLFAYDRPLVKLRIILTCLVPCPCSCQLLQRLSLEVELRLDVDYLIDESEVISIKEVSIGFMFGRHC